MKVPTYRVKNDSERLQHPKLPVWRRTSEYEYKNPPWTTIEDTGDNNFQPSVEKVLDGKKSINIEGRAGTGKSTFIKTLHAEMDKRKI